MAQRQPGYYAVVWTDFADVELRNRRPGPLVGEWDGRYWWFSRMDTYRFDCEVEVVSDLIETRQAVVESRPTSRPRAAV
jgi:hypothetical protein